MDIQIKQAKSILSETSGFLKNCGVDYSLNTAEGCAFGCTYCYAANFPPAQQHSLPWGMWTKLKGNAGDLVREHAPLAGKCVYISSVTDPYQPAERQHLVMRSVLEAFAEKHPGVSLIIQTRGPLVVRDIDLFQRIHAKGNVQVNITLSTDDDELRRAFEPTCPSVTQRLNAVEQIVEAGLSCVLTVTPMLPLKSVEGFTQTITALSERGLKGVILQPFHQQRQTSNIRSTKAEALDVLTQMNLTQRDLRDQGNQLYLALKRAGMKIGTNQSGFHRGLGRDTRDFSRGRDSPSRPIGAGKAIAIAFWVLYTHLAPHPG